MQTMHGVLPHIMVIGMPQAIISLSMAHMLFIMSMKAPSTGIIVHFMPSPGLTSQSETLIHSRPE
jgi:hypothetical protein